MAFIREYYNIRDGILFQMVSEIVEIYTDTKMLLNFFAVFGLVSKKVMF